MDKAHGVGDGRWLPIRLLFANVGPRKMHRDSGAISH